MHLWCIGRSQKIKVNVNVWKRGGAITFPAIYVLPDTRENRLPSLTLQNFSPRCARQLCKSKFFSSQHFLRADSQRKRVTWSSVAKFFSALRALGLQKQNFLRAARARYQWKRVTQSDLTWPDLTWFELKVVQRGKTILVANAKCSPRCGLL